MQIAPVPISELLPIGGGKLPPIQLEASFNEPVSLKRVLEITLENSLPIRIRKPVSNRSATFTTAPSVASCPT